MRVPVLLGLMVLVVLSGCGPGDGREAGGAGQGEGLAEAVAPLASSPVPLTSPLAPSPAIPDWMAKDLASPDAQVLLKAVDRWAQSAPTGSVAPLIQALEDQDERVQARALELIVQDWAREQRRAGSE